MQVGADIVTVYSNARATACGIAYMGGSSQWYKSWAFSTVAVACSPSFTFAHEVGHNMGCGHNVEARRGDEYASYAFGWRSCSWGQPNFRTIMSYSCTSGPQAGDTQRLGYFSSPTLSFNAFGMTVPVGDSSNGDCARALRDTATVVASYQNSRYSVFSGLKAMRSGRTMQMCCDDPAGMMCNRDVVQDWEVFSFRDLGNNQVALVGSRNGRFCADDNSGIVCDRTAVGAWERFTLFQMTSGRFALRGGRLNQLCSDDNSGRVICNRANGGPWEYFIIFGV